MRILFFTALISLITGCAQSFGEGSQHFSAAERTPYRDMVYSNCSAAIKKDKTAGTWSPIKQISYCNCAADRSAETITVGGMRQFAQTNAPIITAHNKAVSEYCMEKLLKVWLPPYLAEYDVARGLTSDGMHPGYTAEDIERVVRKHNFYFSGPAP